MKLRNRPAKPDADGLVHEAPKPPTADGVDASTINATSRATPVDPNAIDEQALLAEYEAEKPARVLSGPTKLVAVAAGAGMSLYGLYWVFNPLSKQVYLPSFLALGLFLTFLNFRSWSRPGKDQVSGGHDNPRPWDWALAVLSIVPFVYIISDWQEFFRRAVLPTDLDLFMGTLVILLVLEAARRTVGILVPLVAAGFLLYAYLGSYAPAPFTTADFTWTRLVGHNVMGTQGIFGVPLDVAATYIILFTIYGAVLAASGATRFFINLSFSAFGQSPAGPGRTVTLAGFLLGTVSGSGVATTVTLGGISWPLLRRAGYPAENGGGVLAAAGIGAILSPPTLGAAAFIIAELLGVNYLQVLLWATIPTLLYYLGIILAVEMDARRYKTHTVEMATEPVLKLLLRFGYHFSSLVAIVLFLVLGLTPFRAVVYATILAFALSFLERESWITPRKLWDALGSGATGALSVIPVMAAAGLIVGVMTLTGLALRVSGIIVDLSGGNLIAAAVLSALSVTLLGLAVPVTASFIISFVVIGPALQEVGVPAFAAAMFIFYYAVLSEVSPPTAMSPFAAAAITGGKPVKTMWLTWKYTLPAFLVPMIFVLSDRGVGLLLEGGLATVAIASVTSVFAVIGLAVVTGSWLFGPAKLPERGLFFVAALALLVMTPLAISVGAAFFVAGLVVHKIGRRSQDDDGAGSSGADAPDDSTAPTTSALVNSSPSKDMER